MIYIFESLNNYASVIFEGIGLTDEEKERSIVLDKLPDVVEQTGKIPVLKCKKETNEVWYDYIDEPKDPFEDRIAVVEDAIAELILGGAM